MSCSTCGKEEQGGRACLGQARPGDKEGSLYCAFQSCMPRVGGLIRDRPQRWHNCKPCDQETPYES